LKGRETYRERQAKSRNGFDQKKRGLEGLGKGRIYGGFQEPTMPKKGRNDAAPKSHVKGTTKREPKLEKQRGKS